MQIRENVMRGSNEALRELVCEHKSCIWITVSSYFGLVDNPI